MTVTVNGTTGVSLVQDSTITSAKIVDGTIAPADTQVGALPSMVRLNTANGYGSSSTMIPRFSTVVTNQGLDITYSGAGGSPTDATLGATFTINTNGVYAISFTYSTNSGTHFGITLNSAPAQLTTVFASTTVGDRLAGTTTSSSGFSETAACTVYLPAGSVIRPHADAAPASGVAPLFTIVRVA